MKRSGSWLAKLPLQRKLNLAFLGVSGAAVLVTGLAIAGLQWSIALESERQDISSIGSVLALNSRAAISFNDRISAENLLSALVERPHLVSACLFAVQDGRFELFASFPPQSDQLHRPDCTPEGELNNAFRIATPVILDEETIGRLDIVQGRQGLARKLQGALTALAAILVLALLIAGLLARLIQALVTGPILALSSTAQSVAATQDFSLRAREGAQDEVGALIDAFNDMLERIEDTQQQLVQTEKLASLGGLVAGVAHEINTPVGVGVTAASTLHNCSMKTKQHFEEDLLTESELTDYFMVAEQSSSIILDNLNRAASLIQSFKQVAVDQTSAEKRSILLRQYVEEVLTSLRPRLKKTDIDVELTCPDDLSLTSYPGALSQVLTNLLMNALIHAYEPGDRGTIRIVISRTPDGANIRFSDDGRGIESAALGKIFDPFYTTKRSEGGSGLGLHISHNLVTQQLQGRIRVSSEPGQGTTFNFSIKNLGASLADAQEMAA